MCITSKPSSSHQTIQHGHAAPVHTSIHKPMPAADPSDVHNPYNADHKPIAAVHAPAHHLPTIPLPTTQHLLFTDQPITCSCCPQASSLPPCPCLHPTPISRIPQACSLPLRGIRRYSCRLPIRYAVADDYAGTNFAANENRDGYSTNGEYRVALPDGRTQVVTYNVADAYSGYIADVKYEGQAHYDSYKPTPHHSAPHHPAPYHAKDD
ncbi:Uncharacterized protein FKW44_002411 [Caligus rogercresseyi]|uniref:Pro-resilin n=1 Tax=Caligus rogercresseyi TaxID=217165 RepID=A0A7T8QWA7_CALRO|nr:Uncharacterized protein FKW44_002411 [Caligus rogercresseyi]